MSGVYEGTELELFSQATHWKSYVAAQLAGYITGAVLEVGAGIGGNIPYLLNPTVTAWTALEPDPRFAGAIAEKLTDPPHHVLTGTLETIEAGAAFDTILYMDVLEHIADDRAQVRAAAKLLRPGGHLIVLAPAHEFLFSPFDAAVGHYRRYTPTSLRALTPEGTRLALCKWLDSIGLLASLANRLVLRQKNPTARQIQAWDRLMVPLSRLIDPLTGYRIGKSLIVVWQAAPNIQAS